MHKLTHTIHTLTHTQARTLTHTDARTGTPPSPDTSGTHPDALKSTGSADNYNGSGTRRIEGD